jgi:hypothetical protein
MSQSDDGKPCNQTARIIPFKPLPLDYQLQCPDCEGIAFDMTMKDMANGLSIATINCVSPECTYWTLATLNMGDEHYN